MFEFFKNRTSSEVLSVCNDNNKLLKSIKENIEIIQEKLNIMSLEVIRMKKLLDTEKQINVLQEAKIEEVKKLVKPVEQEKKNDKPVEEKQEKPVEKKSELKVSSTKKNTKSVKVEGSEIEKPTKKSKTTKQTKPKISAPKESKL